MLTAYAEGTQIQIFASKGVKATCPDCGEPLITKVGEIKIPHFAHKSKTECDSRFYDGMSDWHYNWQRTINNPIPGTNIEVWIKKEEYAKRADLITANGLIIEFQKSTLPLPERITRESYYKNMIWIIHPDISKSQTWTRNPSKIRKMIDTEEGLYDPDRNFSIPKARFIRTIINGKIINEEVWDKLKTRCSEKNTDYCSNPNFKFEASFYNCDQVFLSIRFFNAEIQKIIDEEIKLSTIAKHLKSERLYYSDPQLFQLFVKDMLFWQESQIYSDFCLHKKTCEDSLSLRLLQERRAEEQHELKIRRIEAETLLQERISKEQRELKLRRIEAETLLQERIAKEQHEIQNRKLEAETTRIELQKKWLANLTSDLLAKGYEIIDTV